MSATNRWIRSGLKLTRRWLLRSAGLAFVCHMLVPTGFMPTAIASGSLVALCDDYLPAVLHAAMDHASAGTMQPDHPQPDHSQPDHSQPDHSQHDHPQPDHAMGSHAEQDEDGESDTWEHCPLGALSSTAAPFFSQSMALSTYRDDTVFDTTPPLTSRSLNTGYHSRAPPADFARSFLI
jgi:hypothetical protein